MEAVWVGAGLWKPPPALPVDLRFISALDADGAPISIITATTAAKVVFWSLREKTVDQLQSFHLNTSEESALITSYSGPMCTIPRQKQGRCQPGELADFLLGGLRAERHGCARKGSRARLRAAELQARGGRREHGERSANEGIRREHSCRQRGREEQHTQSHGDTDQRSLRA